MITRATVTALALTSLFASTGSGTNARAANAGRSGSAIAAIQNYWTPERLRSAIPMPLSAFSGATQPTASASAAALPVGKPGGAPGWSPQSGSPPPVPERDI